MPDLSTSLEHPQGTLAAAYISNARSTLFRSTPLRTLTLHLHCRRRRVCRPRMTHFDVKGSNDKAVRALNTSTGHVIWAYTTKGEVQSTPRLSSDGTMLYVGSYDGNVREGKVLC